MQKKKIPFSYDRLHYVLDKKKIKHSTLCDVVGCTYENYKKWRQRETITERDLDVIAKHLNIDFDWLRGVDLYPKTKKPPLYGDYVTDADGYIIPPYRKTTSYSISKENYERNKLFLDWLDSEPLYEFVNQELTKNGFSPIQKKEFNKHMELLYPVLDAEAFSAVIKIITEDIVLRRKLQGGK